MAPKREGKMGREARPTTICAIEPKADRQDARNERRTAGRNPTQNERERAPAGMPGMKRRGMDAGRPPWPHA